MLSTHLFGVTFELLRKMLGFFWDKKTNRTQYFINIREAKGDYIYLSKTNFNLCCFCFIGPKAQYILTVRAFNDYGESKPAYLKAETGQCPK